MIVSSYCRNVPSKAFAGKKKDMLTGKEVEVFVVELMRAVAVGKLSRTIPQALCLDLQCRLLLRHAQPHWVLSPLLSPYHL